MALLFRTPQAALLIDAGRSQGEAARELARLRVRRLDALILTHPDEDHIGGAGQILERVRVGELAFPNACADRPETVALRRRALLRSVPVRALGPGDTVRAGDIVAEVLWPPAHLPGGDNDASLVARITIRGVRVLVSGDLEADGERALLGAGVDLRAEVLQLGHHGSRTSSTWEFLRAVDPVVALAPTGARPLFAYPHPEVAARVRRLPALVVVQTQGIERLSWVDGGSVVVDTAEPVLVRCGRRGGHGD
jgi:competence protein ComEC